MECHDIIPQLSNYGSLLLEQNIPEKALYYFEASKKLISDYWGTDNSDYGIILRQIGTLYAAIRDFDKALNYFSEAEKVLLNVFPVNHPDIQIVRNYISQIYGVIGKSIKTGKNTDKIGKK